MRKRPTKRRRDRSPGSAKPRLGPDLASFTKGPAGVSYRAHGLEFAKYFVVSLVALVVDTALLLALAKHMHYALAATVGFATGAVVHYALSVAFVFNRRRLKHRRWLESGLFVLFGVLALGVNVAVIAFCVELLALPLLVSKIAAAGFSFLMGYALRKIALF